MQRKLTAIASLFLTYSAVSSHAYAGETLERVEKNKELVAVMDQSYPPYSFINEKNEVDGFDADVVKAVAERLGVKATLQTPSWEVIIAGHWRGRWDICICSMTPDEQKAQVLDFVAPYYSSPAVLVTTIDSPIKSNADLEGKKVGVQQGSTYERFLNKDLNIGFGAKTVVYPFKQVSPATYASEDMAYQDLALGAGKRLDAVVSNLVTANTRIQAQPGKFHIVDKPLYEEPNWVAIDKGDQAWHDKLKQTIEALRQDGTLAKISKKWIGSDVTQAN